MLSLRYFFILMGCGFAVSTIAADDWNQWRGENRDGVWRETGVVDQLDDGAVKVLWRQPIGAGYSGPTVADGRVFLMDRQSKPKQMESIRCFDVASGDPLWQVEYEAVYTITYTAGPRASVTVDGGRAFALGSMGHLHCVNVEDGTVIWKRDLDSDYRISETKRLPIWGIACSPIIYGDNVILQIAGSEGACVVALQKATGKEVWRSLEDRGQYSSPVLVKQNGNDVLVCWTGDAVAGLNPASGEVYWRFPFPPTNMPIGVATPVIHEDDIFVTSFYDGSLMLRMDQSAMTVKKVWSARGPNERKTEALHSIISTPIWIGDHIYGVDSYGELRCIRAEDGSRVWENQQAVKRNRWGTIHFVGHGDRTWMFNEQGEMVVGQLSPDGLKVFSRVSIIAPTDAQLPSRKGGVCWAHPAFASRRLFVRNDQELICIDLAK